MNPLVNAPFQAGGERSQDVGRPAAGEGRAWQREMERAQAATWFRGPIAGAREAVGQQAPPASRPGETAASQTQDPVAQAVTHRRAGSSIHEQRATQKPAEVAGDAASSAADVRASVRREPAGVFAYGRVPTSPVASEIEGTHATAFPLSPAMPLRSQRVAESLALPEAASDPPMATRDSSGSQPAVRVHVEDGAHGLAVWLGMDGDAPASAVRAAAVLEELRRQLGASSQRLASVVCNGKLLYGDARLVALRAGPADALPVSFHPTQEQEP